MAALAAALRQFKANDAADLGGNLFRAAGDPRQRRVAPLTIADPGDHDGAIAAITVAGIPTHLPGDGRPAEDLLQSRLRRLTSLVQFPWQSGEKGPRRRCWPED
jgi:hypothetical protein